jgi:hypothetical protein
VTVVEIKGNRVRLGIQAPENVSILRQELCFDTAFDADVSDDPPDECLGDPVLCASESR